MHTTWYRVYMIDDDDGAKMVVLHSLKIDGGTLHCGRMGLLLKSESGSEMQGVTVLKQINVLKHINMRLEFSTNN